MGEGDFFAATFTDPAQLTRFDETLATVGFTMPVAALRKEGWALERPETLALMDKLRTVGTPLGEYVAGRFYRGVLTGLNEAFVIDAETRARLIAEDPKSAEIIKPFFRGRDICKWTAKWANIFLLYIPWHFEINNYPAIKKHLSDFKELLDKRGPTEQGRYEWYALQRYAADYFQEFEKTKIVYQEIATYQSFGYVEPGAFCNNKCFLIPGKNDYLLALLNSKLLWWVICNLTSALNGGARAMQTPYINQLPIPPATDAQKTPIIERVQKILAAQENVGANCVRPHFGGDADTGACDAPLQNLPDISHLEAEIDRLVYDLYGLTEEEIAVVEGKK
jgi:hypothetical protein